MERFELIADPVFSKLYHLILAKYQIAGHTQKILLANRHVKDFCEESRHFAELTGTPPVYMHFDVSSWYDPKGIVSRIERIAMYDNFQEYQSARLKGLHSTVDSDGVCLN